MEGKGIEILSNKVSFENQINGYDIAQVDAYIDYITEAYQAAYDEYNVKCDEYDQLMESFKMQEQSRPGSEVISNTILKAKAVSEKIIADARAEAKIIITDACFKADEIKKNACMDKATGKVQVQKLLDDAAAEAAKIKETAQVVLDSANAEAAKLKDSALSMIDDARVEAARIVARANNNEKQANVKIARTAGQMQPLLLPRVLDVKPGQKPGVLHLSSCGALSTRK